MSELHGFLDEARALLPAAVALRRRIHKKPELGLDLPLTTEAVLDGLKGSPLDDQELQKAKNQEISGFILGRDTDEEKAIALETATVIGKDTNLVNTELDKYLAVPPAQIQAVAKEYFVPQRATVLIVKPAAPAP